MTLPDWIPAWSTAKGYVLGATAAAALCLPLGYCAGHDAGKTGEEAKQLEDEHAARDLQDDSATVARDEAANADAEIDAAQQRRDEEIRNAGDEDARPSAGRNVLNCDRLRRAGHSTDHIPACGTGQD